ncbi:MAG: HEAT repeat domain-containing protein [Deltaproteobacteria bacterium]|nr:HEAT repeat domain-containing protein [Deltaproteobacteria bacterium]
MRRALWGGITVGLLSVAVLLGCEGDPNDPATWIKKLEEGALREKSVEELTRIYTDALNAAHGNNDDPKVKAIRDVVAPALVDAFKKFRDDVGSRDKILDALAAMHDARAEEIFIAALDFVPDLSEPQAVKGAEGLGVLRSQRGVDPLLACLAKITSNRPIDNQMKRAIVGAFGKIGDPRSVPALVRLVDTSPDEQDFFINKLATVALGEIGDPQAVPALIRALFMSGRGAVIFQQARYALVQIGPPAVEPLIRAMRGQDQELNRLAQTLEFEPGVMQWKTARALGDIGDPRAFEPLLEQLQNPTMVISGVIREPPAGSPPPDSSVVQGFAAMALAQIALTAEQQTRAAEAITPKLKDESAFGAWVSFLAALASIGGADRLATIKEVFSREMLPDPGIRVAGAMWWSRMATSDDTATFDRVVHEEDDQGLIDGLNVHRARFVAAGRCSDIQCWIGKLDDPDPIVGDKAAYMLAYMGAGNAAVRDVLIAHLNARNTDVRSAVVFALDELSPQGCRPCVERIRTIAAEEEGRQSYNNVNTEALCTAARLAHREAGHH